MPSKHWTLVGGAVACLIAGTHTANLSAAPWLEPGDPRARFAVQKLADRGHLNRTVTTWPMMWASVHSGLQSQRTAGSDSAVATARSYVAFEQDYQLSSGFRAEYSLAGTTESPFLRTFESAPRESGEVGISLEWQGDAWSARLAPTYAMNPEDDEEFRADGSYIAGTGANIVFGVGAIDRWWGPGWANSLILSNNARPMPVIWANRKDPVAFETPWLSWIGPWQFTAFLGQYEGDRAVPDAKLIGMRGTFRPIDGLDIGFSRAIMLGGEGRPENGSTFWNALIGRDNGQLEEDDPGNQLGSIDFRYGFAVGAQSMSVYGQMMGEDEAGAFPGRKSWLFGTDWTSSFGASDQQWFAEYANTVADDFMGDAMPNISYEHSRYRTGYRYYGRNMAASIEGDAEAITLGGYNFFPNGSNLGASLTLADLNIDGSNSTVVTTNDVFYQVPQGSQEVAIANLSYGRQLFNGWLDINAQITDAEIETISGKKDQWSLGASWRYRF
ncbi:capsule assembly Wzi family protein [uncultured Marinobacter sp.]|uniref:capsule assembly Wzi family protein n=1 Tax=uncultured Marinobacter sp. TaxID=187379 RepID=UPI0030DC1967